MRFKIIAVPGKFALHQNYPNPFNPSTQIEFDIPRDGYTSLIVYDLMGREVKNLVVENMKSGYHQTTWNGINDAGNTVSAGIYLCLMRSTSFSKTIKLLLLK